MFTVVQFWEQEASNDAFRQWVPITLQGGGLFHVAMGAVLGVAAWSRGQEKLAGVAGGPGSPGMPGMGMSSGMPGMGMNSGFGASPTPFMNNQSPSQMVPPARPMSSPPPPNQPVRTAPPRELSQKSKVIIPDTDYDDPDHRPKTDPEARG